MTRQRLIAAASDAFARHGVGGTSLRDVAREAGVTNAVVHYHFGSKEGLHQACLDAARDGLRAEFAPFREVLDGLRQNARGAVTSKRGAGELVDLAVRSAIRAVREQREPLRLLMRGLIETGELDSAWSTGTLAPFLAETAELLAPRLNIPPGDLRLRIQSLVALVVRHALSTPNELAIFAGLPAGDEDQVFAHHERHLVWLAKKILLEE